jgi:autotransporter-associated beta strand protein
MTCSLRRRRLVLLIAGTVLALTPHLSYAALYWDADGMAVGNNTSSGAGLGGSGNWEAAGKWFDGASDVSWTSATDAVFIGAAGTVTLGSPQSAMSLAFKSNGYTITGSALTLGPSPANITTDAGVTATIAATIAGPATMTKLGPGTLILANNSNINTANTTEGGWRIEGGGILRFSSDTALGAPLPDSARNTVTDIQLNQSTIQFGADMDLSINRRTKVNTNSSTQNLGDATIDTNGHAVRWFGSIQGGLGSIRVTNSGPVPGILTLGTDDLASINPFGSALPAGTVNLTVTNGAIVQTSGTVTPTHGELGSETGAGGAVLAIKLEGGGQIRSESGDYSFQRNLILGPGGGSLDTGAWIQTFAGGTITGSGSLSKFGGSTLIIDNPIATWAGGTFVRSGTLQLGRNGSNGLLPGTLAAPSSVVVDAGATLKFVRGSDKSFFDIISGQGGVTIANSPSRIVRLVSDNTYTGLTRIESGVLMIGQGSAGQPGSIVSDVLNNSHLIFNRVENVTYGGIISGTGSVTKGAAGKLTLTAANTYSGGTGVDAGTLVVANTTGSATGTGTVTVLKDATLAGNGAIAGPVLLQDRAHLAPGTSVGNLTVGSLTFATTSVLDYELGAVGTGDRTTITSPGGLSLTGLATVNITGLSGFGAGQYPLLDYTGSFTGLPTNLSIGAAPAGYAYSFINNAAGTSIDLLVSVPEPSTFALLGCLAAFLFDYRKVRAILNFTQVP